MLSALDKMMLEKVADLHEIPQGAYNIRKNGEAAGRNTTANIDIISKNGKQGIDIIVKPIPKISAYHSDAQLVHEAAIGKIESEQMIKLMSLGLSEKEAEDTILKGFLKWCCGKLKTMDIYRL